MTVTAKDSKSREKIYDAVFQGPDAATAVVVDPATSMADTTHSMPVYDSAGTIIGHVAIFANATLA